ncbi:hypothetical protein O181_033765 [Austropuccinia psidii MF-1]|uniref:Uncharacterized protein n=1 Tax=Austropuccinia psidii MF-1 TaxID=1389203 RepID=A0A9Q3H9J1_9BASI|nr:hypothetical protein [Austropuccinia psidii MF-1]
MSKSGQGMITVFYGGIRYTVHCIQCNKPHLTTPTSTPPLSAIPNTHFLESALAQSTLASFIHNDSIHPPIPSPTHIGGIHGPISSEISSMFGDPIAPLVTSLHFSSPALNPPPASDPVLPFQKEEQFNQIYLAFDLIFQCFVGKFYENYHETSASSSNPMEFCCLHVLLCMVMELYNQMLE